MKKVLLAACAALLGCVQGTSAATTTYTDDGLWAAAVSTTIFTTDFEDNIPAETASPILIQNAALSPVVLARGGIFADIRQSPDYIPGFGARSLSTTDFSDFTGGTLRITFTRKLNALGGQFFGVDTGGITGFRIVETGETVTLPAQPNETTTFFGFTSSTEFKQVDLMLGTGSSDVVFFDNMSYAPATIPLPAGAWMLLAGLGALGLRRRRRTGPWISACRVRMAPS